MCCKNFWKKIIAITLGMLIGIFATNLLQKTVIETPLSKGNYDDKNEKSFTYKTNTLPLEIVSIPEPDYTDTAAQNQIDGIVSLRVEFLASGQIGKVNVIEPVCN